MTLQSLLKIGQLEKHETDATQVGRMLEFARRSLADAEHESISLETRLDAAYRAITQLSMVALWANGFRPSKSKPGHHQTMIQSLLHAIELDSDDVYLLDTFRLIRNAIDYTGTNIDETSLVVCTRAAEDLQVQVIEWLEQYRTDLLP